MNRALADRPVPIGRTAMPELGSLILRAIRYATGFAAAALLFAFGVDAGQLEADRADAARSAPAAGQPAGAAAVLPGGWLTAAATVATVTADADRSLATAFAGTMVRPVVVAVRPAIVAVRPAVTAARPAVVAARTAVVAVPTGAFGASGVTVRSGAANRHSEVGPGHPILPATDRSARIGAAAPSGTRVGTSSAPGRDRSRPDTQRAPPLR
ncbi:hypothetical protein ACFFWC_15335 [Plantactinospora siamensis]|uniref:Uncharacterized protein n=1 Tax=Plantactinospora siamensis TaxID=555372 RepID=A0ABV6P0L5_9ACTN